MDLPEGAEVRAGSIQGEDEFGSQQRFNRSNLPGVHPTPLPQARKILRQKRREGGGRRAQRRGGGPRPGGEDEGDGEDDDHGGKEEGDVPRDHGGEDEGDGEDDDLDDDFVLPEEGDDAIGGTVSVGGRSRKKRSPNQSPRVSPVKQSKRFPTKNRKQKKAKSAEGAPTLGAKPQRAFIKRLSDKPSKANLLKGPVSNKVGKDRAGAQIEIANHRIAALQDYVVSQRAELEVLHSQLTSTNTTAFDYIDEQDAMVAFLKRELDQATKEKNDSVNENFRLTLEVKSKKESIATLKKQAAGLERQLMAAKKSSNAMSKQDLIEIDNAKSENAIRVNRDKEYTRVDAQDAKKNRDIERNQERFEKASRGWSRNRAGMGAWGELGGGGGRRSGRVSTIPVLLIFFSKYLIYFSLRSLISRTAATTIATATTA